MATPWLTRLTPQPYLQVHLFDVDVPNGPVLMESRTTAPGARLVACDRWGPTDRVGGSIAAGASGERVALDWSHADRESQGGRVRALCSVID